MLGMLLVMLVPLGLSISHSHTSPITESGEKPHSDWTLLTDLVTNQGPNCTPALITYTSNKHNGPKLPVKPYRFFLVATKRESPVDGCMLCTIFY